METVWVDFHQVPVVQAILIKCQFRVRQIFRQQLDKIAYLTRQIIHLVARNICVRYAEIVPGKTISHYSMVSIHKLLLVSIFSCDLQWKALWSLQVR